MQIQKIDFKPKRVLIVNKTEVRWQIFFLTLILAFCLYQLSSLTKSEQIHCMEVAT